ncbi:hypothetical protein HPB47_013264 [Ixodes persulcatus]|uniref:Uncharacterized protein n=1 Tax=Ixodes persulcatus TaxID=34615 RepID=A0AC60QYY3_IXOPE|nr:hypothetical protein HPB47_013264 [Ixodes persulcatus]
MPPKLRANDKDDFSDVKLEACPSSATVLAPMYHMYATLELVTVLWQPAREELLDSTSATSADDSAKHWTEPAPGKTAATALNDSADHKTEPARGKTR